MSHSKPYARIWYDDYLDLYNLAGSLQDREWQNELLRTMKEGEAHIKRDERYFAQLELWRRYDQLNAKLLHMINRLKQSQNPIESEELQKHIWEIKNQQMEIGKKLQLFGG
ncbi:hypothetical protein ACFQWB_05400 [Paenibacillus thermoaerophilus]|uniref:Uncharacterized protein n=1 Tax=Paenibacillus thermoaerophilus TaxID=1215385 RepID=A0ABW2V2Y7_9BACL|nr:hypothetical protein [Paenibacillus thermoaerophilus]TMV08254.1 hypothetical protein FE781_15345 [Paenibacillus thermoaerophilus]